MYTCTSVHVYMYTHVRLWCITHNTIYAEIFVGEIFRGLNFRGIKFSWLKPPTKICRHENFAILTVCVMQQWLLSSEKGYACLDTTFTVTYGKLLLEKCWFAWESRGMLMTGTQLWSKKTVPNAQCCNNYLWWQNFMGLIFVVEGTHENFNTMKISAYMVVIIFIEHCQSSFNGFL